MMTGRGGWPMTIIMSPQKVPFLPAPIFPNPRCSTCFLILPEFGWMNGKKTDEIGQAIIENLNKAQASQSGGDLNATHLDRCYEALSVAYDPMYGGFGQEPKFPTPHALSFLASLLPQVRK